MPNLGVALPLAGLGWSDHRDLIQALPELGYTDVWTAEGGGADAFTPLAAAAAWSPALRLGTGIVPVFTRGPAVLAQTAATLADLAPGRFILGLGSSVPAHVSAINGIPFDQPFQRVRDTLRFLRRALQGQIAPENLPTLPARGFALSRPPAIPPRLVLGALRPRMLNLAFAEGDGAISNILSAADVSAVASAIRAPMDGKELAVKIFVCPTGDAAYARARGRAFLGWILNQPPYRAFHEWLARGPLLAASHQQWDAGHPAEAAAALPDEVVDALWIHGTPQECRRQIARYLHPRVTTAVLFIGPTPEVVADPRILPGLLRQLAP